MRKQNSLLSDAHFPIAPLDQPDFFLVDEERFAVSVIG
jgi:hypothetical protein